MVKWSLRSHWGIVDLKLRCDHTVSCRGMAIITRLGKTARWSTFKIAPGATKTVTLSLTSTQTRKLQAAGTGGIRALLELRTTMFASIETRTHHAA